MARDVQINEYYIGIKLLKSKILNDALVQSKQVYSILVVLF